MMLNHGKTPARSTVPASSPPRASRSSRWGGDVRVFALQGRLVLSGAALTRIGGDLFRIGDEPWNPDTVEFLSIADGKAHMMKLVGLDLWRIEVP